jgi:hypothetical protein
MYRIDSIGGERVLGTAFFTHSTWSKGNKEFLVEVLIFMIFGISLMLHRGLEYPCWVSFCFISLSVMFFFNGFRWLTFQFCALPSHKGYILLVKIHWTDKFGSWSDSCVIIMCYYCEFFIFHACPSVRLLIGFLSLVVVQIALCTVSNFSYKISSNEFLVFLLWYSNFSRC